MATEEKKSKNPFAKLKHLLKDPVNTAEEADARKKKVLILTIVSFALAVLFVTFLNNFVDSLSTLWTILGFVFIMIGIFGIILLIGLKKMKQKFADLECPKCHTRIEFSKNVQVEEQRRELKISTKVNTPASSVGTASLTMDGNEYVTVKIKCKCQKCGAEKEFIHTFRTATVTKTEKAGTATAQAIVKNQMENDLRQFQSNGFSGDSRGFRVVKVYTMNELVEGYFGNVVQIG